jgi:hypothetical protein
LVEPALEDLGGREVKREPRVGVRETAVHIEMTSWLCSPFSDVNIRLIEMRVFFIDRSWHLFPFGVTHSDYESHLHCMHSAVSPFGSLRFICWTDTAHRMVGDSDACMRSRMSRSRPTGSTCRTG